MTLRWMTMVFGTALGIMSGCGATSGEPAPTPGKGGSACVEAPYTPPPVAGEDAKRCAERVAAELAHNDLPHNDLPHNDLPHNDLPHNALSVASLRSNHALLEHLGRTKLDEGAFREPAAAALLTPPNARALMAYIASCALDGDAKVPAPAGAEADGRFAPPFRGEMGLCGRGSPAGSWRDGPPSPQCLELVSSCLLARTNALGKRVILSVSGEPSCLFPQRDRVPVETKYREHHGTTIPSFEGCPPGSIATPGAECGFAPLHVGRCDAGEKVQVKANRPGRLRACKGLYGCTAGEKAPPYAGLLAPLDPADERAACSAGGQATLSFMCPSNGPRAPRDPRSPRVPTAETGELDARRWGYYSLMFAPCKTEGRASIGGPVEVVASTGAYPASEAEVFTYREGSFHGNLFPASAVAGRNQCEPQLSAAGKMLTGEMFACHSEVWNSGLAHLADRLCADPTSRDCFGNLPGRCLVEDGTTDSHARCADVGGMGPSYRRCKGDEAKPAWPLPITVYLNHPCDLASSPDCAGSKVGKLGIMPPQN